MNRTITHELTHAAQAERRDANLTKGHLAIGGMALVVAFIGNRLGGKKGAAMGAVIGYELGYMMAPHEKQARKVAGGAKRTPEVISRVVSRKAKS